MLSVMLSKLGGFFGHSNSALEMREMKIRRIVGLALSRSLRGFCQMGALLLMASAMSSSAFAVDIFTPEIDPGSLATAIALLTGGTMLFKHAKK